MHHYLILPGLFAVLLLSACASAPSNSSGAAPVSTATTVAPAPVAAVSLQTPMRAPAPAPVLTNGPTNADGLQPLVTTEAPAVREVAALTPPVDLWDRIRRGFAMPDLDTDLVRQQEQWYAKRPDYIQRMTERSSKYLFHIVEELERRNMPTELALLPFIESAFNPQAVSTAKAAGMWQFIPSTGRHFDLKQNAFRDDRRDVLASTRAALDYLQKLYGMFGDWHLALAAYNWGEGSVSRAIARNQRAGLGDTYTDLKMPNETRNYVPKLQAVKNIVASPHALGVELPVVENHPYFQVVDITRDIDVALAAQLADVRVEDFRALNPSAKGPVILAAGTPQILLPWDNATVFQRNFEGYTQVRLATWTAWMAPATMSPAQAAKRIGMSEAELRQANNIPPNRLIKVGSTLLVHRPSGKNSDVAPAVADNAQLVLAPAPVLKRTVVKAGKADTVASLAKRYKVSAAQVAQWNKIAATANLKPEQAVVLFLPVQPKASSPRSKAAPGKHRTAAQQKSRKPPAKPAAR